MVFICRFHCTSTTRVCPLGGLYMQVPLYINYYNVSLGWSLYTGSTIHQLLQCVPWVVFVYRFHALYINYYNVSLGWSLDSALYVQYVLVVLCIVCVLTYPHTCTYIHTQSSVLFLACSFARRARSSTETSSILFSALWEHWTENTSALRSPTPRPSRTC